MTARSGMATLVSQVRGMTDAGTADYTIGTAAFWDDDHVQEVLDRHRCEVYHERLRPILAHASGGSVVWKTYQSEHENLEATTGGSLIFVLQDATGANVGTALYTPDYQRGIVTFTNDTLGSAMYLTGRAYDLYGAAADVWRQKAGNAAKLYDFEADGQRLSRSQWTKHCLEMADLYAARANPITVESVRSDTW